LAYDAAERKTSPFEMPSFFLPSKYPPYFFCLCFFFLSPRLNN
jgi:hypothetical protein